MKNNHLKRVLSYETQDQPLDDPKKRTYTSVLA